MEQRDPEVVESLLFLYDAQAFSISASREVEIGDVLVDLGLAEYHEPWQTYWLSRDGRSEAAELVAGRPTIAQAKQLADIFHTRAHQDQYKDPDAWLYAFNALRKYIETGDEDAAHEILKPSGIDPNFDVWKRT